MKRNLVISMFLMLAAFACSTHHESSWTNEEATGSARALDTIQASATSANILVFGDYSTEFGGDYLKATLETIGHSVTISPILPLDLLPYNTIWHIGNTEPLTAAEQTRLAAFVNAGGGLHLTGEREEAFGVQSPMNASLEALVNTLVASGGVQVGELGSILPPGFFFAPYPANPDALGGITTGVSSLQLTVPGGMAGIPESRNILAYGDNNVPVGAIWESADLAEASGGLSIIMDNGWFGLAFYSGSQSNNDNLTLMENLQAFLTLNLNAAPVANAGGDRSVSCAPAGGTTTVGLSGAASSDADGDALTYAWFEGGVEIATGVAPSINLAPGVHTITLVVTDTRNVDSAPDEVVIEVIECAETCVRTSPLWEYCTPECPCAHGEGDCDEDLDCLPGLRCLHDPGPDFGYGDLEVDVCSNDCPTLGVGAWNYCTPECPCSVGQGDCETDADCEPGLRCTSDVGPNYGFDPETDICEPPVGL